MIVGHVQLTVLVPLDRMLAVLDWVPPKPE